MKTILAAAAALAILSSPLLAADTTLKPGDPSPGTPAPSGVGKSTNSDGSTGAAATAPGTSINDGAGSASDQKPASGSDAKK